MLFLCLVIALTAAQNTVVPTYQRVTTYVGNQCTGRTFIVKALQAPCDPSTPGVCDGFGEYTDCVSGVPGQFENAVGITAHSTSSCDDQYPEGVVSWDNGVCVVRRFDSWSVGCSYGRILALHFPNSQYCYGSAYVWEFLPNVCQVPSNPNLPLLNISSQYVYATCNPPCFHVNSEIESPTTGKIMTLESLKNGEHPECHVPHELSSNGVKLTTSCSDKPLRITNDHLVFTPAGQVTAVTLKAGDVIFKSIDRSQKCHVISTEPEINEKYFAVNCEVSKVMADGVFVSTFGNVHRLPELWMTYASKILGVKRASVWGDKLVTLAHNMGLY